MSSEFANWFRETTPYISVYRGKTFVVSLCGAALMHDNLTNIVHDLALLQVLGVRLVIVHGARPQLDAALTDSVRQGGLRITRESDLPIITAELGKLRSLLEVRFSNGLPGSPLHNSEINLVSGNFVAARPIGIRAGVDHQFTGQVRSLRTDALRALLDSGAIVLLGPTGISPSGQVYNLAAEDLAAETAIALGATKLITFAPEPYISDATGQVLPELTPGQLDALLATLDPGHPDGGRLAAMLRACRAGVPRCQQVSFAQDGTLLTELFTADGQGSQLSEAPFRNVRAATPADLSAIVALIRPLEQQGALVRRSRLALEQDIGTFLVAEVDDKVFGCCALTPFIDKFEDALELACLAVHPSQRNSKSPLGEQLLAAAESAGAHRGFNKLFVLTTEADDWFIEHGFKRADLTSLPLQRQKQYDKTRNSNVLVKSLSNTASA